MRAAVLIGVNKAGNLQVLADATSGVRSVADWARAQGFDAVVEICDDNNAVRLQDVKDVVKEIVESDDACQQLLIYFAGHGVNIQFGEYWLLSDAPDDPDAAVNLTLSVELARRCGIPHVVIFSDACRTAPAGIQAHSVTGGVMFPNLPAAGASAPVDLFYGCALGTAAYEVQDPKTAADGYRAVYTAALTKALTGEDQTAVERAKADSSTGYLRPRPLQKYLSREVPRRLVNLNLHTQIMQGPDAIITSEDATTWISELHGLGPPQFVPPGGEQEVSTGLRHTGSVQDLAGSMLHKALDTALATNDRSAGGADSLVREVESLRTHKAPALRGNDVIPYLDTLSLVAHDAAGDRGLDTAFVVTGASVRNALCAEADTHLESRTEVRVDASEAVTVMIILDNHHSVTLPAVPGMEARLTFHATDDDVEDPVFELLDVAYSSQRPGGRGGATGTSATDSGLQAAFAAAARVGALRLHGADIERLHDWATSKAAIDPAAATYCAHVMATAGRLDLVASLADVTIEAVGGLPYDVALLLGQVGIDGTLGTMPLLSRGWPMVDSGDDATSGLLHQVRSALRPSPWTVIGSEGTDAAAALLESRATP